MQEKKIFCHWDLLRFLNKTHLKDKDGSYCTLSVTGSDNNELMIFLSKTQPGRGYQVEVKKCKENGAYVPHKDDKVKSFDDHKTYIVFYFTSFENALDFVDYLGYRHKEYQVRPTKPVQYAE